MISRQYEAGTDVSIRFGAGLSPTLPVR